MTNKALNDNDGCGDHKSFTLTEYPDKELIKTIFRHPDIYDRLVSEFSDIEKIIYPEFE